MNLISLIIIVHSVLIKINSAQECYPFGVKKILLRRKRFLSFPAGSSIAVKRSFSKAIVGNVPRGLNLNIDCGIYFPLPEVTESWDPLKFIYGLNNNNLNSSSKLKKKIDANNTTRKSNPNSYLKNDSKLTQAYLLQQNKFTNVKNRFGFEESKKSHYSSSNDLCADFKNCRFLRESIVDNSTSSDRGKHETSHHTGVSLLEASIESCITKAVCEINESVLSLGRSFIFDVLHMLLQSSVISNRKDDYHQLPSYRNLNCSRKLFLNCPHNLIGFLTRYLQLSMIGRPT